MCWRIKLSIPAWTFLSRLCNGACWHKPYSCQAAAHRKTHQFPHMVLQVRFNKGLFVLEDSPEGPAPRCCTVADDNPQRSGYTLTCCADVLAVLMSGGAPDLPGYFLAKCLWPWSQLSCQSDWQQACELSKNLLMVRPATPQASVSPCWITAFTGSYHVSFIYSSKLQYPYSFSYSGILWHVCVCAAVLNVSFLCACVWRAAGRAVCSEQCCKESETVCCSSVALLHWLSTSLCL